MMVLDLVCLDADDLDVVAAGLLDRDALLCLLFPLEEDDILNILFFFHNGVQANLAPDVPGVIGEPGGVVWLPVVDVGDGGLLATPVAPSAPSSRCTSSAP